VDQSYPFADAMPEIFWTTDGNGVVNHFNPHWFSYTGLTEAESFRPEGRATAIHPDDLGRAQDIWNAATFDDSVAQSVFRIRRAADDRFRWHCARSWRVEDVQSGETKCYGMAIDIEEEKRAEYQLRFLSQAGLLLTDSLELPVVLQNLADLAVSEMADWCAVYLRDEVAVIKPMAIAHKDKAKVALAQELARAYPAGPDDPVVRVVETDTPLVLATISDEAYAATARDERHRQLLMSLGMHSAIVMPLRGNNSVVGALALISAESARNFNEMDVILTRLLAKRAAIAIENAQTYEAERNVAKRFQEALLPHTFPEVPQLKFDAAYLSASSDVLVGGDWYDAMLMPDGRIMVSIGDVTGSGLSAAITMGKMRERLRTLALRCYSLNTIMRSAEKALYLESPHTIVTAIVGFIDLKKSLFTYAGCGHPSPMLRKADGAVCQLSSGGAPLGLAEFDHKLVVRQVKLSKGSMLILYTDGLTEATRDIEEGERLLISASRQASLALSRHPAQDICQAVLKGKSKDDVAIMTVTFS